MPRGSKPGERRGGRKRGTPNKLTSDVKSAIVEALERVGGVEYLAELADSNKPAFAALLGRVLPLQHTGADGGPIALTGKIEIELVRPGDDSAP